MPECGATSDVCVEAFKTCLTEKHPYTRRPVPTQCDCYPETVSLGCSPACVDSIFQSYGELSQRCYNFNAYEGCLYIDGYRLPAERFMEVTPSGFHQMQRQQQLEVVPTDGASTLKKTKSRRSKSKKSKSKKSKSKEEEPAAAPPAEPPAAAVAPPADPPATPAATAASAVPPAPAPAPAVCKFPQSESHVPRH